MQRQKVSVSERALIQRLNRALRDDGTCVKKTRPSLYFKELGDYYVLDFCGNFVVEKDVDIEALGREKKVLAEWERLRAGNDGR